tara:strand:+ start:589 stop:783 length:195 start_codon:yes stop_codon:yes gene_type:complete
MIKKAIKLGDLVKINNQVDDPRFPENRIGVVVKEPSEPDLLRVYFVNGFVTDIFVEHLEIISQK